MTSIEFNYRLLNTYPTLKGFAWNFTGNQTDAEDLMQETVLKALTYREKFTEQTNFSAWLYTIMKNTFINNYRRSSKFNQLIKKVGATGTLNALPGNKVETPYSNYQTNEIKRKIDALATHLRTPFQLHLDGFKYEEISEQLQIPIGTVKSRIYAARKALMAQLNDYVS